MNAGTGQMDSADGEADAAEAGAWAQWKAALRSGSRLYWMVQAVNVIVSVLLTLQLLALAGDMGAPASARSGGTALAVAIVEAGLLLLATHVVVRPLLLALFVNRQPPPGAWLLLVAAVAAAAAVATLCSELVVHVPSGERRIQEVRFNSGSSGFSVAFTGWRLFAMQWLNTFLAYAAWAAVYLAWKAVETRRRLQRQVRHARLWQLTRQMGPHFLFNAFNSIRGLVYVDQARAARMITQLSDLLRYQLDLDQHTHQRLGAECAVARDYLEIECARLDPRLAFAFDIDDALADRELPALTLLTAVENAVKHGVAPNPQPGWVQVSARSGVQGWILEVVNSCDQRSTSPGTGIGLRNLKERLALSTNGRCLVDHWREQGTFHLRIEMPA